MLPRRWTLLTLLVVLAAAPARADTVTLNATRDTTLFAEEPTFSNGAGDFVFGGTTDRGHARRALLAFDLSSIPPGSIITSVTLSLYCSRAKTNDAYAFTLHRVSASWGEGTSHAPMEEGTGVAATGGDATWSHRVYPTQAWATAGGDFDASASASSAVARDGSRYTWSSVGMVADVQAWLAAPSGNHGWLLRGPEGVRRSAKRFDSGDSATLSRRPILTIVYTPPGVTGACCAADGGCTNATSLACTGTYRGDRTSCSTVSCPLPTGACCSPTGTCTVSTSASCTGSHLGAGTSCSPNPCPIPTGACCGLDGTCSLVSDPGTSCAGTYLGPATLCSPNPCTATTGACCASDGTCSIVNHPGSSCVGTYRGARTTCATGTCPLPSGACCAPDGSCTSATSATCGGVFLGGATSCGPSNPCPQPTGAYCSPLGACTVTTSATCGGTFLGAGASCVPSPCPLPSGACCGSDGTCSLATVATCGGSFLGAATSCGPANPCPQPTGACCGSLGACTISTSAECAGTFLAERTCAGDPCPVTLTPFVDPLPLPRVAVPRVGMSGGEAEYTMAIRQLRQRLHRDLPETVVWGYDDGEGAGYPGPTIEARSGVPLRVTWENDLRDETGALRTDHYLPVDACPHGAELGGARAVVHLHGGHVPAASDGYPESTILPGERVTYEYPNWQDAAQIWYHDHAMGITRLNVYMGLAGLYTIRDDVEDALDLPRGEFEVPLVVQDRTFRPDGSLAYPAAWQEDFHGEINLVNGRVWPYFEVARGRYRFRMLNGSNGRTYTFYLSNGAPFTLIGTDGGLLPAPVTLTEITLGPAERADVIVDFSELAPGTEVLLLNRAPAHYPGEADHGVVPNVMKLIVTDRVGHTAPVPSTLRPMERLDVADAVATRDFVLRRGDDPCTGRAWFINDHGWHHITERPVLGTSEVWRFVNRSGISHPMHMHLVFFQVLDRQPFEVVGEEVRLIGEPIVPEPWERGWKDTVMVHPNEMVRVIARFEDFVGRYPYHCHILEHEDHEMMRQMETTTVCGDGARGLPIEECDDGNTTDGDGCSATCAIEPGFDGGVRDGGVLDGGVRDAGVRVDAGARDAGSLDGSLADGGTTPTASGCGCRAASGQRPLGALGLSALVLALLAWRSARARDKRPVGRAKGTSPKR